MMKHRLTIGIGCAALLFGAAGCLNTAYVESYAGRPTLEFQDLAYESPRGRELPVKRVALPGASALYGLPIDSKVAYVELNPKGGTTLLFLHGLGSHLGFWRYQLDNFAQQGHRVLALDMFGYGKSDKPSSFPYTTESMATVVREFLAIVKVDRPILIGHSMGGQTALSYAIQYPDRLTALVLAAPAGFEHFSRKEKLWFRNVFTVGLIKGMPEGAIWGTIRRNNFFNWRNQYRWLIEERIRSVRSRDFDNYAYANVKSVHGLAENDFVRQNLDKIKVPTLILYGDKDRLIPNPFMHGGPTQQVMQYGRRNISSAALIALPNCGHTLQIDCSRKFNVGLRAFLETAIPRSVARH